MAMKAIDSHYYFSDVQVRGAYSSKSLRSLAQKKIELQTLPGDDDALRAGKVDLGRRRVEDHDFVACLAACGMLQPQSLRDLALR